MSKLYKITDENFSKREWFSNTSRNGARWSREKVNLSADRLIYGLHEDRI